MLALPQAVRYWAYMANQLLYVLSSLFGEIPCAVASCGL